MDKVEVDFWLTLCKIMHHKMTLFEGLLLFVGCIALVTLVMIVVDMILSRD